MGAFGEKLRKQREHRGIELDAISNTTKISTRMLRALEDEHFDQLPGGVFNKGFVRAYARLVGLDEEEAITDYLTALRESQIQAQSILPDFRSPASKPDAVAARQALNSTLRNQDSRNHDLRNDVLRHHDLARNDGSNQDGESDPQNSDFQDSYPSRDLTTHTVPTERFRPHYPAGDPAPAANSPSAQVPWGKLAGALLLVALLLTVWNSRRHGGTASALPTAAASNPIPASPQSPAPASAQLSLATAPSHPASSLTVGKVAPAEVLSSGRVSQPAPLTLSKAISPTASGAAVHAPGSGTPSIAGSVSRAAENDPDPQPNRAGASNRALAVAEKPPTTFTVLIRAEKTTWVSITADGKPFAHETLIAPANTSVRANREVVVKAGNAAGVSFLLNGKEIPAAGGDGEVKTYVFDATGFRVVPQPQTPTPVP